MKLNRIKKYLQYGPLVALMALISLSQWSCKDYLEAKPDKSLQIPQTLGDLQAILDYTADMNLASAVALEVPADDCVLPDAIWNGLTSVTRRNLYIWERDVFNDNLNPGDWAATYVPVYRANVVLEALENIKRTQGNGVTWDQIRGSALMYRARGFFDALQLWAKAYDPVTAKTDLGVPLRLNSNFNLRSVRASVEMGYQQVIDDLKQAITLLPDRAQHMMRPSKGAAYGYLARTYLVMQNYSQAGLYADLAIKINAALLDYNTIPVSAVFPFSPTNVEVIFCSAIPPQNNTTNGRIAQEVYEGYDADDLRKQAFFKAFAASAGGGIGFKGSYYGTASLFNGISSNEMYLIRAECYARANEDALAIADLNTLLKTRWLKDKYIPLVAGSDVLSLVLRERRKELLFRGLRWSDLKRLNRDTRYAKTIYRQLGSKEYVLLPNDPKYALSIPNSVIETSGISQN